MKGLAYAFDPADSSQVWELRLTPDLTWKRLLTSGVPPPRRYHASAVYDPSRDRIVLFGGTDGLRSFNDLWTLSVDSVPVWTPWVNRMVWFGGYGGYRLNDTWSLSWSAQVAPSVTCPGELRMAPGGLVRAEFTIENRRKHSENYYFTLASARAWPQLPLNGNGRPVSTSSGCDKAIGR